MARQIPERDIAPILSAAESWIKRCLIEDGSVFTQESLWNGPLIEEVREAFIGHPDEGADDFMTKLKGQMGHASVPAQHLMSELLWALLLFPSNIKSKTKRRQICETWSLSGQQHPQDAPLLRDEIIHGIGSGGPGFLMYRYRELAFLIEITRDLKKRERQSRQAILSSYDAFMDWIGSVPQEGSRQYRHMLRYFAFPDRVERMSSNRDRRRILTGYECGSQSEVQQWSDKKLDDALFTLRKKLQNENPSEIIDFYALKLRERWDRSRKIKTIEGEVPVSVPGDEEDEEEENGSDIAELKPREARESLQIQAALAEIGAIMGFRIWIPRGDRERIRELMSEKTRPALLDDLPLNYDRTTLATIEQIDVLWLKGRAMARAFEVEHTTPIYSGLLRMADLLALQPNMDIRLHIVAREERREKVFREMLRPVFSLLDRGPLARRCTFLSYESVGEIHALEHLAYTSDAIIKEYEEPAQL
jgi:hypothetical protein